MPVVIFATPFFNPNAIGFIRALGKLSVTLGVIAQEAQDHLPQDVRACIHQHYRVSDALNKDMLLVAATEVQKKLGRADVIFAANEQIQVPLAEVREMLGVAGMSSAVAKNFRDKAVMKDVLRDAGVSCATYERITAPQAAYQFIERVGLPVVLKPLQGAASQATFKIETTDALRDALRVVNPTPAQPAIIEEFITGEEFSLETVLLNGKVMFQSVTTYSPTPLFAMQNPWVQWTVVSPKEIHAPEFDDIKSLGAKALLALGMQTGVSHLEWFRRHRDGSVAISEVGARPPGAQIMDLVSHAHGIDFNLDWVRLMVFGEFAVPPPRVFATGIAFLRGQGHGRVKTVEHIETIQRVFASSIVQQKIPVPGQEKSTSYEGEGYILVKDSETAAVQAALKKIISTVKVVLG
jgi:biotin carboxylase